MRSVSSSLHRQLERFGAVPTQVVDLERSDDPRILRYLDLRNASPTRRRPLVVESAGEPRLHVFDGQELGPDKDRLARWCLRATLRGDGALVAVLEPGRLTVYRPELQGDTIRPVEMDAAPSGRAIIPRFLYNQNGGEKDLPRRSYLFKLLERSIREATGYGLSSGDALSVAGRGLLWRFLVDRGFLKGLQPGHVCDGATEWAQCLDTKARALRTFDWLDTTFNGGLLPFEKPARDYDPEVFRKVLGNIAHGATEDGQLRLPSDWREVNFAHIPVGLLSEVYEAFAHVQDTSRARGESIYYTPRHIADFVISEALAALPSGVRPRVLDPAAGAGVFLVTAYRQLAERRWKETRQRPTRKELRRLLNEQLTGFDINGSALRLAELALYLTALELDPDPKPLTELRFEELRDRVLFLRPGGVAGGSLGPVEEKYRGKFDLVVGNPPWTANSKGDSAKKGWVSYSRGLVRDRLGKERAERFNLPDNTPDLPFVWRAMEWTKPSGHIALVTHARWLFGLSERYVAARRDLLEAVSVTGILNCSALRQSAVWPNVDAPSCLLFATNEKARPDTAFHFVSPMLDAAPDQDQSRLRIDWLDAQTVAVAEVLERPWTLKARFRGNRVVERVIDSMQRRGMPLGDFLESLGTRLNNGYQVGGAEGKQSSAQAMRGMPDLRQATDLGFVIDAKALPRFEMPSLLRPRRQEIYRAPLLLVRKAVPADSSVPRSHLAWEDVAFHQSFNGASFADVALGREVASYLQVVLQSSLFTAFEVMTDPQYGVFVDAVHLDSLCHLPVVTFDSLDLSERKRAVELSRRLSRGMSEDLARDIDEFAFDLYCLSRAEREAIRDLLATGLTSTDSKRNAVRRPRQEERVAFATTLARSLENVLSASGLKAIVRQRTDLDVQPWHLLQVDIVARRAREPVEEKLPEKDFFAMADDGGASLVIVRANEQTWLVGVLGRYALWTPTRARMLATDLIAERSSHA